MTQKTADKISAYDKCPHCGMVWGYEKEEKWYTHLVGLVRNDFVQEWLCPNCYTKWDRFAGIIDFEKPS